MAEDLYQTLGVAKDASAEDIRKGYRKLAKQFHPDLNPGDKAAEEKFKAVSAANELLSDPEKRARYDKGEIDASGAERATQRSSYRHYADAEAGQRYGYGGAGGAGAGGDPFGNGADFEDIFSTIFSGRAGAGAGGGRGPSGPRRGRDAQYRLETPFLDAVNGATSRLTLPDGATLDVKIPAGTQDGDILRLRGKGGPGSEGAPAGDALIELAVAPHAFYRRDGNDIRYELPVSVREVVLGAKVTVPTPAGPVAMALKPDADAGTELRLRGRGVPAHGGAAAGDLYVTLRLVLGPRDPALTEAFAAQDESFDPRAGMEGGR